MIRLLALNLNHRTRPKPVPPGLVDSILSLRPDIAIFNEYVDEGEAGALKIMLSESGFGYQAVSDSIQYSPGRWHNQVLIASRSAIEGRSVPNNGPHCMSRTNTLTVTTFGLEVTGIRVPAYTSASDWYRYWEWMKDGLRGDVAIGDFNADPGRPRKWDRVLDTLVEVDGWTRPEVKGTWSYLGNNGSRSRVDHVLTRGHVQFLSASYVYEPFVPSHTDHAALLAEVAF